MIFLTLDPVGYFFLLSILLFGGQKLWLPKVANRAVLIVELLGSVAESFLFTERGFLLASG